MKTIKALKSGFDLEIKNIPADKSISHRCAILATLSNETSVIENYLEAEDTVCSLSIIKKLGYTVIREANRLMIIPTSKKIDLSNMEFYCGNSGTTMRIFAGLLAGMDGNFSLSGDEYLMKRPMDRIVNPLKEIGCNIEATIQNKYPPVIIKSSKINSFDIKGKVASAQVKSALILAGLRANGVSYYEESIKTRNHTENMLIDMGAKIKSNNNKITIHPMSKPLNPLDIVVPSDPSSAFFFAVATCIIPNSKIILRNVSLNETRIEGFKILEKMGANITYENISNTKEVCGDICISSSNLKAVIVEDNIAWLIDEIPALAIAFIFAKGVSVVKNAKELRVKECDRIKAMTNNLKILGVQIEELEDGFEIVGGEFKSGDVLSYGDHRIAMSFAILGLVKDININEVDCINTSFPNFFELIERLRLNK